MKLNATTLLALATVAFASSVRAQAQAPPWVSEKATLLRQLGIDPTADLAETANYHWSWTSHGEVVAGGFHCPPGSTIDVSRSIVVVRTQAPQACRGPSGETVQMLKVSPDGSAEPLGGAGG